MQFWTQNAPKRSKITKVLQNVLECENTLKHTLLGYFLCTSDPCSALRNDREKETYLRSGFSRLDSWRTRGPWSWNTAIWEWTDIRCWCLGSSDGDWSLGGVRLLIVEISGSSWWKLMDPTPGSVPWMPSDSVDGSDYRGWSLSV